MSKVDAQEFESLPKETEACAGEKVSENNSGFENVASWVPRESGQATDITDTRERKMTDKGREYQLDERSHRHSHGRSMGANDKVSA